ncbi:lantibiotic dehydratase [Streptomyces pathocidini]|uniref:lantibiotic dehydratase n=1 Tax=Streptomyces pathocidini TaxID=1650571 RepID=UPI0033F355A4
MEADRLTEYLREVAADPVFAEAVALSSPSLARRWHEILGQQSPRLKDLRRVSRALTAYRLRMSTRCTPFGIMAGVAVARIAEETSKVTLRLGSAHRLAVRPESDWLTALAAGWELRPEILRHLRVMANNLCFTRGERLVLPYVPENTDGSGTGEEALREVSVRYTAAVRAARERARTPVAYADLERHLCDLFPQAARESVAGMLVQLVAKGLLLTELRPPADADDPIRHVLTALAPSGLPEVQELEAIAQALADCSAQAPGEGGRLWQTATSRIRRLRPVDRAVHVDLALDAQVRLPPSVGVEAERAATLLWRLAPDTPGAEPLRHYHEAFVERYGLGQAVPVKDLLNPDTGLGAPAGYQQPPSNRPLPQQEPRDDERDRLLLDLAQDALMAGEREVVLTDEHPAVIRLSRDGGTPPASLEMFTRLAAETPAALRSGEFRLVVDSAIDRAGASFGRFAYLLHGQDRSSLAALAAAPRGEGEQDAVRAQLVFQSRYGRAANVTQTPRLLHPHIPVGVYAKEGIDLDDLAVCADSRRLFLVRLSDSQEITPAVFHMLNPRSHSPNVARFLSELPRSGVDGWRPWEWGAAAGLPHTPRVRYGRAVLALARWKPTEAIRDQDAPFGEWTRAVHAWQMRWRVPERVCVGYGDWRLELDLTQPLHLRVLRHELSRRPETEIYETLEAGPEGAGWLAGPDGAHRSELVFPMITRPRQPRPSTAPKEARPRLWPRSSRTAHLPGGEWLYATVYCAPERHDELLTAHLPRLTAALPADVDRWFFLRYRDQDHHLRLRFHGTPGTLTTALLPTVHTWAADLRSHGLIQRLTLDTYEPETARYGGPEAIAAAEHVFCADSRAVVETLGLLDNGRLPVDPLIVAAAGYVNMACAFFPQQPDEQAGAESGAHRELPWEEWLLHSFPANDAHKEFQRRRHEAISIIDPYTAWAALRAHPGGNALLSLWAQRSRTLVAYSHALRSSRSAAGAQNQVLSSLFHMHHNRLIGIDPQAEKATLAIARGALQAHRDRRRSRSKG